MSRTPIDALFDQASFTCTKCGEKAGTCSCWIDLECPSCGRQRRVQRESHDLPGTARVVTPCPDCCRDGDRPEVLYFDKDGRQIFDDGEVSASRLRDTQGGEK